MKQIIRKELVLLKDLGMLYPNNTAKYKVRFGIYECFCGIEFKANSYSVKHKLVISCGCIKKMVHSRVTHGLTHHRLYKTWRSMMQRCNNQKIATYKYYGGRGIKVCDRWKDVRNFIEDVYPDFQEGKTLDRIDTNGNYEPSNCRWVDNFIQARNTRRLQKNNTSGYRGVSLHKNTNKWSAIIGVDKKKIRIGYFKTAEEGARAYDKYVIDNNLEHPTNFKREDK